jgi:hypothetical protein
MIKIYEYGSDPSINNNSVVNLQVIEGNPITTTEQFFGDAGEVLRPLSGFPLVQLLDGDELITSSVAYFKTQQPDGNWFADITIPNGFDFEGKPDKIITLQWIIKTLDSSQKTSILLTVLPKEVLTEDDETAIIVLAPVTEIKARVPYLVNVLGGDRVAYSIYDENNLVFSSIAVASTIQGSSTVLSLPIDPTLISARLRPYNLIMNISFPNATRQVFTLLRVINPSILSAMQSLEMSINKANQAETIRGLRFRESDLLEGLTRGLDYFNDVPPSLTSFTGIDMRGSIREGWLICSSIRVLRAQLQAEGWFAFDFSGQNVSLNVDRTSVVESAVGHYESLIDSLVRPLKTLLSKKGVISGDGSVGDKLANMSQMGITMLSNTTITRSRLGGYPGSNIGILN